MIYKKINREKSQRSTKQKFWCSRCDGALIGEFGKCPNCGFKENNKKIKNKQGV